MSDEKPKLSYTEAAHGIQTGIAWELERGSQSATPKHLRVGVNLAMSDHAGLVRLLIEKGIFTEEEYLKAITDEANRELDRVEKTVNDEYGGDGRIKLR
jgi:hypothetical protein